MRELLKTITLLALTVVLGTLLLVALSAQQKLAGLSAQLRDQNDLLSLSRSDRDAVGRVFPRRRGVITENSHEGPIDGNSAADFLLVYVVTLDACNPCVEQDVDFLREVWMANPGRCRVVIATPGPSQREALSVVHRYGIDWPVLTMTWDVTKTKSGGLPVLILLDRQWQARYQYTHGVEDSSSTQSGYDPIRRLLAEK